jgi:hypothetical protein
MPQVENLCYFKQHPETQVANLCYFRQHPVAQVENLCYFKQHPETQVANLCPPHTTPRSTGFQPVPTTHNTP